jgi:3-methyladenine DNA glycosylase/8-oxoguanine DNA glycosylase
MEPADFLALSDEDLRAVGLSGAKMRYGRSLASDIVEGRIDFRALDDLDDEAAIAMLCQAKGIGRWTAEIYLMFAHGRLVAIGDPFDHTSVLRARKDKLLRVGLSNAKIKTLKEIARAIEKRHIHLDALADIPADDAHALLTQLHGIGPWTADLYLLACLGHADAWPAGDLALQEAARIAFGLRARPTTKEMGPLADTWRPYRAVAARLLWTYYRAVKNREGVLLQAAAPAAKAAAKKRGRNG